VFIAATSPRAPHVGPSSSRTSGISLEGGSGDPSALTRIRNIDTGEVSSPAFVLYDAVLRHCCGSNSNQ
jgi:hypothetical protein